MKLALGMRFQNEEEWLDLHARYMAPAVDGIVAIDGGSKDKGAQVIRELGGVVRKRKFDWDFGAQSNALLDLARLHGYDALLMCDPDECVDVEDIARARELLETWENVRTWLLHFIEDRRHVTTIWTNDRQVRFFRLFPDTRYEGRVHERLINPGRICAADLRIYHYGVLEDLETRSLQWANFDQAAKGMPLFRSYHDLPESARLKEYPPSELYRGRQPLDPDVVGLRAPLDRKEPVEE